MAPTNAGLQHTLILENLPLTRDCWRLKLQSKEISHRAQPGQFVMIRVSPNLDPLLPRPFSFCQIHPHKNSITVVYKTGGPGTSWLSTRKKGEKLPVLGPLGNPFTIPKEAKSIALVAGGIGVTPLISLGEKVKKLKKEISFFLGLKTKDAMTITDEMLQFVPKDRQYITTDDGTLGEKGYVLNTLEKFLKKNKVDYIASCGPKAMLMALQPLARELRINTEVAVEQTMACGLGY